jgi:two-component system, response regulator, stage 0 sporulation protein F
VKAASPTTTIVLISAYATPELQQRGRAAGAEYVMPKPFVFEQLETIVREGLG